MKQLPQVSRDLLEAARIVERGWCQGAAAKDEFGKICKAEDDQAISFCALGALWSFLDWESERTVRAIEALQESLGQGVISFWNDAPERTQAEVVKALQDAALKAAEEQG